LSAVTGFKLVQLLLQWFAFVFAQSGIGKPFLFVEDSELGVFKRLILAAISLETKAWYGSPGVTP